VGLVVSVEDGFNIGSDLAFEMLFGDLVLNVLLEMKLAALPWGGVKRGFEGCLQAAVRV